MQKGVLCVSTPEVMKYGQTILPVSAEGGAQKLGQGEKDREKNKKTFQEGALVMMRRKVF